MKTATETIQLRRKLVTYSLRDPDTDEWRAEGSTFERDVLADLPAPVIATFQAAVDADATGKDLLTGGNVAVIDTAKPQAGQLEYLIQDPGGAIVRHGEIVAVDIIAALPAPIVAAFRALCTADAVAKGLIN